MNMLRQITHTDYPSTPYIANDIRKRLSKQKPTKSNQSATHISSVHALPSFYRKLKPKEMLRGRNRALSMIRYTKNAPTKITAVKIVTPEYCISCQNVKGE